MSVEALAQAAGIVVGTFASEDLTTIGAAMLAADGRIAIAIAVTACALGIWLGDLGLWAAGRYLERGRLGPVRRFVERLSSRARASQAAQDLRARLARRPGRYILFSRFLPGTRLPLYLSASALGVSLPRFAAWSAVAVSIWTPLLVGLVYAIGTAAVPALRAYLGAGWIVGPIAIGLVWQRRTAVARPVTVVERVRRWEFWPAWIFYAPMAVWVCWLMLRHGARALAAANPGLEDGGFAGESKSRILDQLPAEWALAHVRLDGDDRMGTLRAWIARTGTSYPIVLKPDVGQRGTGVSVVRSDADAEAYLARTTRPVIAQVHHAGPYEAGIFYYRRPSESRGRIFSITDKQFPFVVGDGASSVEQLIRRHHRYRFQVALFLKRLGAEAATVPPAGRLVPLGAIGNHAQGALFLDGADLITDALTTRIDAIARSVDGFFIGRFDVRYRDPRRFMSGDDLAIVELNGVTSEATHIYDPSRSLLEAYRTLAEQWRLVFEIGRENLARGLSSASFSRLIQLSARHVAPRKAVHSS